MRLKKYKAFDANIIEIIIGGLLIAGPFIILLANM